MSDRQLYVMLGLSWDPKTTESNVAVLGYSDGSLQEVMTEANKRKQEQGLDHSGVFRLTHMDGHRDIRKWFVSKGMYDMQALYLTSMIAQAILKTLEDAVNEQ